MYYVIVLFENRILTEVKGIVGGKRVGEETGNSLDYGGMGGLGVGASAG
jgi:hypothetical protein